MPTLPLATAFTGAGVTEGQFKTAITDQREFLAGLLGTAGTQAAALTTIGAALNGVVGTLTAAITMTTAHRGKLLDYTSGTITQTLLAAAAAGDGFVFGVRNSGAGIITLDPDASEAIDGANTVTLASGESCLIVCDGTGWKTVGKSSGTGRLLAVTSYTSGTSHALNPLTTKVEVGLSAGGGSGNQYGGGGSGQYIFVPLHAASGSISFTIGGTSTGSATGAVGNNSTYGGKTALGGRVAVSQNFLDFLGNSLYLESGGAPGGYSLAHGQYSFAPTCGLGFGGSANTAGSGGLCGSAGVGGKVAAASWSSGTYGAGGSGRAVTSASGGGAAGSGPLGGNGGDSGPTNGVYTNGGSGYIIIWEYA